MTFRVPITIVCDGPNDVVEWPPYHRRDRLALMVLLCDLRNGRDTHDAQMLADIGYNLKGDGARVIYDVARIVRRVVDDDALLTYNKPETRLLRVRIALYVRALARACTPPDLEWGYDDTAAFGPIREICLTCGWTPWKSAVTKKVRDCPGTPLRTRRIRPLWEDAPARGCGRKTAPRPSETRKGV